MIAWSIPLCVVLAMAAVCTLDRHQRRHRIRLQLRQIRANLRFNQRAQFTQDVALMCDWDLNQAIAGICRATATAEHTNNPATKES